MKQLDIKLDTCLGLLKHRLINTKPNKSGEMISIFTDEELNSYIQLAEYEYDEPYAIVSKAYCLALMAQTLVEAGREHDITDNGVFIKAVNVSGRLVELLDREIIFLNNTPKKSVSSAKFKEESVNEGKIKTYKTDWPDTRKLIDFEKETNANALKNIQQLIKALEKGNYAADPKVNTEPVPEPIKEEAAGSSWAMAGAALLATAAMGAIIGKDTVCEKVEIGQTADVPF